MNASFIVWFHTARKSNLLQTLHFLEQWHQDVIQDCELITVCQNKLDFDLPIIGWKQHKHFDMNSTEMSGSRIINFAVEQTSYDKIIVLESDRILPAGYFKVILPLLKEGVQITTSAMKKLLKDVDNATIESGDFESYHELRSPVNEICVKSMWSGNTAFVKSDFYKSGRMDEEYVGYGWTDSDMTASMERIGVKSIFREEVELHLWHEPLTYGKKDPKKMFIDNGIRFCKKWKQPYPEMLKKEIGQTVVYQWWGEKSENPCYSNLAHPVVLSIATLRAVNKNLRVVVMNCSSHSIDDSNWGHFKDRLNFDVIHVDAFLEKNYSDVLGYKLLSRLFDVQRNFNGQIIYCDSDVFWFRDPAPLTGDMSKFCFDGSNSGFFYYDTSSDIIKQLFEIFEAYTITCLRDKKFCEIVKQEISFDPNSWSYIWDEKLLHYIQLNYKHLFCDIPRDEHGLFRYLTHDSDPKMLHCNGLNIPNPIAKRKHEKQHCRGLACLLFTEFYNNVCKVLSNDEIAMIFTDRELNHYLPQQFSLLENIDRIKATAIDEWNCDLQKTLVQQKLEIP